MIYLDAAATTFIKPNNVAKSVFWASKHLASPGRGQYSAAENSAEVVYKCREKAAKLFNVGQPDNIIITFNATHALNIAINSLTYKGCRAVVSGFEHNAVMRPLRYAGADITVASSDLFDKDSALRAFDREINKNTDVVVCTMMSNVFGFILPIYEIAEMCKEKQVPLIVDASQAAGVLDVDFRKLGAAFAALPGHKGLYGPQGTGLLLCNHNIRPLLSGGTGGSSKLDYMPDYMPDIGEAGTHNMPGIAGLCAGLDFVIQKSPKKIMEHERYLTDICVRELNKIRKVKVFKTDNRTLQGGVVSFTVKDTDSVLFSEYLSKRGICVRAGLHCAPLAHKTAGTLESGTVRISFSAFTKPDDIFALIYAIKNGI